MSVTCNSIYLFALISTKTHLMSKRQYMLFSPLSTTGPILSLLLTSTSSVYANDMYLF